jgi:hypothetical protein
MILTFAVYSGAILVIGMTLAAFVLRYRPPPGWTFPYTAAVAGIALAAFIMGAAVLSTLR